METILNPIPKDSWNKLTKPTGDRLVARQATPDITPRLLCAADSEGRRHLLISLAAAEGEYRDVQSRGVHVATRELAINGKNPERYLDIVCLDARGHAIFDLMGGEIAGSLADGTRAPAETVKLVLTKWRRFWGEEPHPLLSREEQLGVFAELYFLVEWLIPVMGEYSVMNWRGPWGSRHDFEWGDKSVEVKATTNTRGRIHHIHGISQLENPENGPLYLFSLVLREERGAKHNLPGLINACKTRLEKSGEGLAHFENSLVHLGYSPAFEDEYSKLTWRVVEETLFEVKDDFPRLTNVDFPNGISRGIERVDYEINLNVFSHLIVASEPEQLYFR